jgi:hypothetical protein
MFHLDHQANTADRDRRFTLPATYKLCQDLTKVEKYTLDVCAEPLSTGAMDYYSLERGEDGLVLPWHGDVWCNPPWSDLFSWTSRAWEMWQRGASVSISLLIPVRTEQPFWQTMVEPYRDRAGSPLKVHFLPKRQRFGSPLDPLGLKAGSPPFICCLLHWSPTK